MRVLGRISRQSPHLPDDSFSKHCAGPCRWTLILIGVYFALLTSAFGEAVRSVATQVVSLALIEYMQKNYPAAFPKSRVELEKAEESGA